MVLLRAPRPTRRPAHIWRRGRWSAAVVLTLFVVAAALVASCTISSESPDATFLGTPAGPSSGTTTTEAASAGDQDARAAPASAGGGDGSEPTATEEVTDGDLTTDGTGDPNTGDGPQDALPDGAAEPAPPAEPADSAVTPDGAASDGEASEDSGSHAAAVEGDTGPPGPEPQEGDTPTKEVAEQAFGEWSKVSTVGIGAVYFGMSPEEAAERVGTDWEGGPSGGSDCYIITPATGPPGVGLWVYHGTVERVDVDTPLLRTQSGLGVGTHIGELRSVLGDKLEVMDHPYLPGWTLATFVPTDPNDAAFRIAFEVSGGEVIRFRAGRTQIVGQESCG